MEKKRNKEKKTYKICAICTMTQRVRCKKNNNIAISFSKEKLKIIKSTVTPFKQSLIQHYTS